MHALHITVRVQLYHNRQGRFKEGTLFSRNLGQGLSPKDSGQFEKKRMILNRSIRRMKNG